MQHVRAGVVFYLRPHRELLADDGVRERSDWEEVVRIDGMVKLMLEMFAVPYIPVASLSMQERTRTVERVLQLSGLERERPRRRYLKPVGPVRVPIPAGLVRTTQPDVIPEAEPSLDPLRAKS